MNTRALQILGISAVAASLIIGANTVYTKQSASTETIDETPIQMVKQGEATAFSVTPREHSAYQWMYNGAAMPGQTSSTLVIEDAQISDAGFYSCYISNGADVTPTGTVSLEVFTMSPDFDIVVFAAPITYNGGSGTCPGHYAGYVNYIQTNGWGWLPNTNTTLYTASDTTRTNTKVEYVGDYGDEGCNKTSVTIPHPAASTAYRFSIIFTNNVPTTNYPITLVGFTP